MHHTAKLNITRLAAVLLTILLLSVQWLPAYAAESGSCGEGLEWSFSAGVLTITGEGDMTDFSEPDMAPWYDLRDQIRRVVFPDGLTSVGNLAFYQCKNLTTVILPDTVREVGIFSFAGCESLTMLDLGVRVTEIKESAFDGCISLAALKLPDGLQTLGSQAFYRCESLTTVTIPSGVREMGTAVFAYCKNLIIAKIDAYLKEIPDWTFYGCDRLTSVVLAQTVESVENYAFKNCDKLTTVYFDGDEEKADAILQGIVEDNPEFEANGQISQGNPLDTNMSGSFTNNGDGTMTYDGVSVRSEEDVTLVTKIEHTYPEDNANGGGNYSAQLSVTVENKDAWESAASLLQNELKNINDTYASDSVGEKTDVTVYMKDSSSPDGKFVQGMIGRDVELTVVSPNGSSWQFDCSALDQNALTGNYDYSYTISKTDKDIAKKLGTDDGYLLNFAQSAEIKAEVLVQLPSSEKNASNAFLYQIESDGSHTRLQAVKVDQNAVAHFYLASVNKDTQYVIGLDVPDEKTDDVIIPDELYSQYGNAIARLEKIEYVVTGVNSSWGMDFGQVTLILVGVLAFCIIVVGIVIGVMSKRKYKKNAALPKSPTE